MFRKGPKAGRYGVALHPSFATFLRIVGGNQAILDNAIAEIQAKGHNPARLDLHERVAIWIYTSTNAGWYYPINHGLRNTPDQDVLDFTAVLEGALLKLKKHRGKSYRGILVADMEMFKNNFYRGKIDIYPAFTSSSANRFEAFDGNFLFIISSKNGRVVGDYSDNPREEEILFSPGTRFEVTYMERLPAQWLILLDEVV